VLASFSTWLFVAAEGVVPPLEPADLTAPLISLEGRGKRLYIGDHQGTLILQGLNQGPPPVISSKDKKAKGSKFFGLLK